MNILYISHLSGKLSNGPSYSVPAQIKAQSSYDNVFWWNLTNAILEQWLETGLFHGIQDYPNSLISNLPSPFNVPDLVVFEDFYYIDDVFHALECKLRKIPYVITPRGALTWQGQSQKHFKKSIANFFAFRPMVRNAAAIQFLTKNEFEDSGNKWNKNYFIEPNGIHPIINKFEKRLLSPRIIGTYIGRFDVYHKGLDLLYEAVLEMQDSLRKANITINLFGPEREGQREIMYKKITENKITDVLTVNDGVFGADKETVLRKSDFFIMTSRYEGMPMALIEAMSYGIPCFASQGTNLSEDIRTHKAGWSCENTVESIKSALNQLIQNKTHILEYGKNAYLLSLKYSWDTIAKRTHIYFEGLITK